MTRVLPSAVFKRACRTDKSASMDSPLEHDGSTSNNNPPNTSDESIPVPSLDYEAISTNNQLITADNSIPTSQLLVSRLPRGFSAENLKYEFHKALWKRTEIKNPNRPIISCDRQGDSEAVITFESVEAATIAGKLSEIEYDDCDVQVEQLKVEKPKEIPTCKVRVLSLSEDFSTKSLEYEICKALWRRTQIVKPIKPIVVCDRHGKSEALLTFDTVENATIAAGLMTVEYEDSNVQLEQVKTCRPKETPTCKVKVISLPKNFCEENLVYEFCKALWRRTVINKPYKPILSCDRSGDSEAVVIFDSVENATLACGLITIEYDDCDVILEQVLDTEKVKVLPQSKASVDSYDSEEEAATNILLKNSVFVRVSNLPAEFDKKCFVKFLNEKMIDANFVEPGEKCVQGCFDTKHSSTSLIVKFGSCEEANLACLLEDVVYSSCKLKIVKHSKDCDNNVIEGPSTPSGSSISITSVAGTLMFCKMLIKHRNAFPKSGSHDDVLDDLRKRLLKKGVRATVADLRARRKALQELDRKKCKTGKTHEFIIPGSVIFEGADVSLVKGSKYDPDEEEESDNDDGDSSFKAAVVRFSSVAAWSVKSSVALVGILIDNSEDYHKPIRRSKFWTNVSNLMAEVNFFYSPQQCENRAATLKANLKDYLDEHEHSGAAGPSFSDFPDQETRKLMGLVFELMKGSATIEPKAVVGAGIQYHKNYAFENEPSSNKTPLRVGRSRPPIMKRKQSLAERKVAALERTASAFDKIAQKYFASQIPEDDDEDDDFLCDD